MGITRRATEPTGVTNASAQPEIVIEIDGLTFMATPPSASNEGATDQPIDNTADGATT